MDSTGHNDPREEVPARLQPVAERPTSHDERKEPLGYGCRPGPRVHDDNPAHILLMPHGVAHPDGSAPILDDEENVRQIQMLDELFHRLRLLLRRERVPEGAFDIPKPG